MRVALVDFGYPADDDEAIRLAMEVGGDPEAALRMYRAAGYSDADKRLSRIAEALREGGTEVTVMYMYKEPRLGPGYDVYISMIPFLTGRSLRLFLSATGREPLELGTLKFYRDLWAEVVSAHGPGILVFHSSPRDPLYEAKIEGFSSEVCPSCARAFVSYREGWLGPPITRELIGKMPVYPAGFWCENSEVRYELMGTGARAFYPGEWGIARGLAGLLRGP